MGELPNKEKQNNRFTRSLRLTRAEQYRQVFSGNFRIKDSCITLLVRQQQGQNARIGFAIAKKQVKLAVQRNRLKRLFRESFRNHQHDLPCVDIVVMVRTAIVGLDNDAIQSRLERHWQKIKDKCVNC